MLVPEAMQDGLVAATNAVRGPIMPLGNRVNPTGSFTDPEYAQVGLTEANARRTQDVVTAVVRFDSTTRTIIDGHKVGFCKLIADRKTSKILGCHVVGERAVDIVQVAAIAIAGGMRVEELGLCPALVSYLRGDPGQRGGRRGTPARPDSAVQAKGSEARGSEAPAVVHLALRFVNQGRRRGRASPANVLEMQFRSIRVGNSWGILV